MQEVTLYIDSIGGQQTVSLENEISFGRTELAKIALNDPTLSRLHATIFREGEDVWLLDENSSNGCFVNGERVATERKLRNGDEILLGSNTRIYVEINQPNAYTSPSAAAGSSPKPASKQQPAAAAKASAPQPAATADQKTSIPLVPLIGGA